MKKDLSSSVRARLLNLAKAEGSDFNSILVRYGLERLLYRITQSSYANDFLLKGALLFTLWYDMRHRPTLDADLLGFGANDLEIIKQTFFEIVSLQFEDGIIFIPESITVEEIKKNTGYSGIRVELICDLAKARSRLQVDIGFGDVVTPNPEEAIYPVLIKDFPPPKIKVYPVYTVISEKLHAIYVLGMVNSRVKDYFDIFVLLENEDLNQRILAQAIAKTFSYRKTIIPEHAPIGLTEEFANDSSRQKIWNAFLKKNELEMLTLSKVVQSLRNYLKEPLMEAAKLIHHETH